MYMYVDQTACKGKSKKAISNVSSCVVQILYTIHVRHQLCSNSMIMSLWHTSLPSSNYHHSMHTEVIAVATASIEVVHICTYQVNCDLNTTGANCA
jgi:hypothetical protein